MLNFIRLFSGIIVIFSLIFLFYCFLTKNGIFAPRIVHDVKLKIGSNFSLINQDGKVINSDDFKNKYMMIFFGFSSCKKICPMNLGIISEILANLDEKINNKLQAFFITIDPERDNVQKLKEFHKQFDHRIEMLTGERIEIDRVIASYKVYVNKFYNKKEEENEINHSSIIYLIGPDREYITHFVADLNSDESQSDKIITEIKKYVAI